jgi:hypothetical protein
MDIIPEEIPLSSDLIQWANEQELLDLVNKQILKAQTSECHAIIKSFGKLCDQSALHSVHRLQLCVLLSNNLGDKVRVVEVVIHVAWGLSEGFLEPFSRPLKSVLDLIGKGLQSADRNGFFRGISGGSVMSAQARDHHSGVSCNSISHQYISSIRLAL